MQWPGLEPDVPKGMVYIGDIFDAYLTDQLREIRKGGASAPTEIDVRLKHLWTSGRRDDAGPLVEITWEIDRFEVHVYPHKHTNTGRVLAAHTDDVLRIVRAWFGTRTIEELDICAARPGREFTECLDRPHEPQRHALRQARSTKPRMLRSPVTHRSARTGMDSLEAMFGKKKKKKRVVQNEEESEPHTPVDINDANDANDVDEGDAPPTDYTYGWLLARAHRQHGLSRALMEAREKARVPAPSVKLEGRKSIWDNCMLAARCLGRDIEHIREFVGAELSSEATVAGGGMTIRGRYKAGKIQAVLRRYINDYVVCRLCNSLDTELEREPTHRLLVLRCCTCHGAYTVTRVTRAAGGRHTT